MSWMKMPLASMIDFASLATAAKVTATIATTHISHRTVIWTRGRRMVGSFAIGLRRGYTLSVYPSLAAGVVI